VFQVWFPSHNSGSCRFMSLQFKDNALWTFKSAFWEPLGQMSSFCDQLMFCQSVNSSDQFMHFVVHFFLLSPKQLPSEKLVAQWQFDWEEAKKLTCGKLTSFFQHKCQQKKFRHPQSCDQKFSGKQCLVAFQVVGANCQWNRVHASEATP